MSQPELVHGDIDGIQVEVVGRGQPVPAQVAEVLRSDVAVPPLPVAQRAPQMAGVREQVLVRRGAPEQHRLQGAENGLNHRESLSVSVWIQFGVKWILSMVRP